MIQTVDIFKSIVSTLTANLVIDLAIDNNDGTFTLETTNTYWISELEIYDINGKDYQIVSLVQNTSLLIKPIGNGTIPIVAGFNIPAPLFFNGTLKMAQNEIDNFKNKMELVPFVYLYEVIKDRKNTDDESTVERECDLRFFFVNSSSFQNMLTEDVYEKVIYPLHPLVELFIAKIKASSLFTDVLNYDEINLINFSEEGNQKTSIFDINLSAIECRLQAEIREVNCNDVYIDPTIICLSASYEVKYINGTLIESGTISSGGSKIISVPNPTGLDAIAVLKDELGNIISTTNIPCGVTEIIIAPNSTININGNLFNTVVSGGSLDIPVIYENLTPVGTIVGNNIIIPNPITCSDATYTITTSALSPLYTGTIPSGGDLQQVIRDSQYFIVDTHHNNLRVGSLLSQQILSEAIDDSTVSINNYVNTFHFWPESTNNIDVKNISGQLVGSPQISDGEIIINSSNITNSDTTLIYELPAETNYQLPDTYLDIEIDGIYSDTATMVTLGSDTITINLI